MPGTCATLKAWLPAAYAAVTMGVVPALLYTFLPLRGLRVSFFVVAAAFGIVGLWVLLETVTALIATVALLADARQHLGFKHERQWPEVTYIIAAFLNNEAPILDDTLAAYQRLRYPGTLNVMVVYNAKGDQQREERALVRKWHGFTQGSLTVSVLENNACASSHPTHPCSRSLGQPHRTELIPASGACSAGSKAQNVNAGLCNLTAGTQYVFVMDADHHPIPIHTLLGVLVMEKNGYDVCQGACTIRRDNLLSWVVATEFEDIYNVGHRGRTSLYGVGVFGGSNGIWKRDLLTRIEMDYRMLTEDIDSSLRSTLEGAPRASSLHSRLGGGSACWPRAHVLHTPRRRRQHAMQAQRSGTAASSSAARRRRWWSARCASSASAGRRAGLRSRSATCGPSRCRATPPCARSLASSCCSASVRRLCT